ncbi:MAG: hypothetical protein ACTHZ9_09465 [Leucobacter sp.]
MSEQDEDRPLTRRERRLRDMGLSPESAPATEDAATQTPVSGHADAGLSSDESADERPVTPSSNPAEALAEPEISLYDEDGTPRTRRELRRLRDEALAAAAADAKPEATPAEEAPETESPEDDIVVPQQDSEAVAETDPEPEAEAAPEVATTEASVTEPPSAAPTPADTSTTESVGSQPSFDDLLAPTEQYSVADLQEAASGEHSEEAAAMPVKPAAEAVDEPPTETPPAPKRRGLWRRNRSRPVADEEETQEVSEADAEPHTAETDSPSVDAETEQVAEVASEDLATSEATPEAQPLPVIKPEVPLSAVAASEPQAVTEPETASDDVAPAEGGGETPTKATGYSFPDIVPPEEPRPVLDNPASHGMQGPATEPNGAGDDFDDLISRAVAQEGTAGSSSTAALILPSMPEGEGYSGSLGETGELFVTGSIELPRSLGETGGHVGVHESVDNDALEELGLVHTDNHDSGPVSARSAVSARTTNGSPLVAETTKEKSKLPLVLSLTGGGLLLAIAAAAAWAFSQGFFG